MVNVKVTGTRQLPKNGVTEITSDNKTTHPDRGSEYSFGGEIIK